MLERLIGSIPDDPEIEVLVVDDHSDAPPEHVAESRSNVTMLRVPEGKRGAGAGRNEGLACAEGQWLLFADADDVFLDGAFTLIWDYLDSFEDIIYFKPVGCHSDPGRRATRHTAYAALVREFLEEGSEWIRYRFHVPWSKLVSAGLVKDHGIRFDETLVANDLVFSLKTGIHARHVTAIYQPIYQVTEGTGQGLSAQRGEQYFEIRFWNHLRYNQVLTENGLKSCRMAVLSTLRKALRVSAWKLVVATLRCLRYRQPFWEHPDYRRVVANRKRLRNVYER